MKDKIRDDIGPEDFGIPAELADRARNYAAFALSHAAGQEVVACPECSAPLLYECVACSDSNYPAVARSEGEGGNG